MNEKRMNVRRIGYRTLAVLLCLLTVFSLIQPGMTIRAEEYTCGYEAHEHTDACYKTVTEMQPVKELRCTYADSEGGHKHEGACYQVLDCDKPLIQAHIHGSTCYAGGVEKAENLICTRKEAHVHDDMMCYSGGRLICGKEESHAHEDSCYRTAQPGETGKLVCTIKTTHKHDSSCYVTEEKPVSRRVLICQKLAHTHNGACTGEGAVSGLDTTGFSEKAMFYANLLSDLEIRIKAMRQAGTDAAGYEQLYTDLENEMGGYDEQLSALYSAGELSWTEFDALYNGELDRISSLFYSDVVPEEEAAAFVSKSDLDKTLKDQGNGISNGLNVAVAVRMSGEIPGEPSLQDNSDYIFFTGDYNGYKGSYRYFSQKPSTVIKAGITSHKEFRFKSITGSALVAGLADGTGEKTHAFLQGIDWDKIIAELKKNFSGKVSGTDGKTIRGDDFDNYEVVCYIIKYQASGHEGWHVDCALVPKEWVTLSYDMNLPTTHESAASVAMPNAHTVAKNESVTTRFIKYGGNNLKKGDIVVVKDQNGDRYEYEFQGWAETPNGAVVVQPGGAYTVTKNQVLYAKWKTSENVTITLDKQMTASEYNDGNLPFYFKVNGTNVSLSANGGVYTVDVPWNSQVSITEEPGNYRITQVTVNGTAQTVTNNGVTFTANDSSGQRVVFTNERRTTSLTVDKVVAAPGAQTELCSISIYLDGSTTPFRTVSIKAEDEPLRIEGIPVGAKVKLVETVPEGYYFSGASVSGGTAVSNGVEYTATDAQSAVVFNNVQLSTLEVSKTLVGKAAESTAFDMEVKLEHSFFEDGKTYSFTGVDGTWTAEAGAVTVDITVDPDNPVTLGKVPVGTKYTVTENLESSFGYNVTYAGNGGNLAVAGGEVTVTNTELETPVIDPSDDETGIRVIKELLNADLEAHGPYTFNLTQVKDKDGTPMDADTVAAPAEQADKSLSIEKDKDTGEFRFDITFGGSMLDTGTVTGQQKDKTFYYKISETTSDDFAVNADENEYVVEVTLTGTQNNLTAAVTNVYKLDGTSKTGTSLGSGIDEVTFENVLLGTIELTKDLQLFEGASYGEAFKMWLTITGEHIKEDMVLNVNGTDYDYSKNQSYDKATLKNGELVIETDLQDAETLTVKKIPAGSTYTVAENGKGELGNQGFGVSCTVDGKNSNRGTVPAKKTAADDIKSAATVTNAEQWAQWENEDDTDGIRVTKFITNPDGKNHTFKFLLEEVDRAGVPVSGGLTMEVPVTFQGDKGEVVIPVTYKTTDLDGGSIADETKSKYFYYRITEVAPDGKQSTHDPKAYIVTVLLTGKTDILTAKVTNIVLDNQPVDLVNPGVNFTNTLLGSFTLEKQVMTLAGWASSFDFEITSDALDGDYAAELNGKPTTVNFKNGKANVKLRDKDVLRVYEIPHGTEVTIQEYAFDFVIRHKINGGRTNTADHTEQTITTDGVHILYLNYYDKNQLPQTGQLNWPIPVLLGLGAGLVMGGIWLSRKKKKEED